MRYQNTQGLFKPNKQLSRNARIKNLCEYYDLCDEVREDFEGFWKRQALEKIDWFSPFSRVLNDDKAPFYKWFEGGTLNVSYQCLDRHMKTRRNKAAIVFEGEMGDYEVYTYRRLL
ncbi:acetyl-coenzyme A synthetase N-terminal domain-containing protein, partial [Campylobacter coli]|nr:acetyl-coenzyme A synthetase [Campylobacter coli]